MLPLHTACRHLNDFCLLLQKFTPNVHPKWAPEIDSKTPLYSRHNFSIYKTISLGPPHYIHSEQSAFANVWKICAVDLLLLLSLLKTLKLDVLNIKDMLLQLMLEHFLPPQLQVLLTAGTKGVSISRDLFQRNRKALKIVLSKKKKLKNQWNSGKPTDHSGLECVHHCPRRSFHHHNITWSTYSSQFPNELFHRLLTFNPNTKKNMNYSGHRRKWIKRVRVLPYLKSLYSSQH